MQMLQHPGSTTFFFTERFVNENRSKGAEIVTDCKILCILILEIAEEMCLQDVPI